MVRAGLSIWNNNWSELYDFTPKKSQSNFSLQPENVDNFMMSVEEVKRKLKDPSTDMINHNEIDVCFDSSTRKVCIPQSSGNLNKPYSHTVFLLFQAKDE